MSMDDLVDSANRARRLFDEEWAEILYQTGRKLFATGQANDGPGLKVALVLPTLSFAENLVAMGFLLEEFQQEYEVPDAETLVVYWGKQVGERASLIYRDRGGSRRTCLRNGVIEKSDDSTSGLVLKLENTRCDDYSRLLSTKELFLLSPPVDSAFTTTTHARNECAHSVDALADILGSETLALRFLLSSKATTLIDSTSHSRIESEGNEDLKILGEELRLGDIIRTGHLSDSLPANVFWRDQSLAAALPKVFIAGGSEAVLKRIRKKDKHPVVFLLERSDSRLCEAAGQIAGKCHHPNSEEYSSFFLGADQNYLKYGIEIFAWR
jgi:hypothetical protein